MGDIKAWRGESGVGVLGNPPKQPTSFCDTLRQVAGFSHYDAHAAEDCLCLIKIPLFIHFKHLDLLSPKLHKFKVFLKVFGYLFESKGNLILCLFGLTMVFSIYPKNGSFK